MVGAYLNRSVVLPSLIGTPYDHVKKPKCLIVVSEIYFRS